MDVTRNGNPRAHATVELTYPETHLGSHKLLLKGTGNDAIMAATTLVEANHAHRIDPSKILVWLSEAEAPVEYSAFGLWLLANSLLLEELGVI